VLQLNETTKVRIRPTEPVQGFVRVDYHHSNGSETGVSRTTAFLRLEDRSFVSPPPFELTSEQIDTLLTEYNSTEKNRSPFRRSMHVDALKRDDGTFDIRLDCEGFEVEALGAFLEALHEFSEGGDGETFLTMPVVRELEDPELMAELDRRMASVRDGTAKTLTLEEVLDQLKWDQLEPAESPESDNSEGNP